jgi:hypothetical protein
MKGRTRKGDGRVDRETVAKRAYALFLERGGEPGHEVEDWLEAERQLRGKKKAAPRKTAETRPD